MGCGDMRGTGVSCALYAKNENGFNLGTSLTLLTEAASLPCVHVFKYFFRLSVPDSPARPPPSGHLNTKAISEALLGYQNSIHAHGSDATTKSQTLWSVAHIQWPSPMR